MTGANTGTWNMISFICRLYEHFQCKFPAGNKFQLRSFLSFVFRFRRFRNVGRVQNSGIA